VEGWQKVAKRWKGGVGGLRLVGWVDKVGGRGSSCYPITELGFSKNFS